MSEAQTLSTNPEENKTGNSGCGKAVFYLLIAAVIMFSCCCCGFFGFTMYIGTSLKNGIISDTAEAEKLTEEHFGKLNLPANMKSNGAFVLKFPLFSQELAYASVYTIESVTNSEKSAEDTADAQEAAKEAEEEAAESKEEAEDNTEAEDNSDEGDNTESVDSSEEGDNSTEKTKVGSQFAIFFSLDGILKGMTPEQFKEIVVSSMKEESSKSDVKVLDSNEREIEIGGKKTGFVFANVEDKNGEAYLMVSGAFESSTGKICNVFMLFNPEQNSQESVSQMLKNIQ